jgi:hypothetical protein
MTDTVLVLQGIGVALYSTRFASQTLEPLGQAAATIYRDVNGVLRQATPQTGFQKYRSQISCSDLWPFAAGGIWPGLEVTVDCAAWLSYATEGGSPERTVVEGSEREVGTFTFYRPRLAMMVVAWKINENEAGAAATWSLDLEEV